MFNALNYKREYTTTYAHLELPIAHQKPSMYELLHISHRHVMHNFRTLHNQFELYTIHVNAPIDRF